MSKRIPVGIENFSELVTSNYLFCDKTLMIKELLDRGEKVSLFTRPRRWGKTLNMSMLQHFFAPSVAGQITQGLFDRLNIGRVDQGKYLNYQGQFPVIFITLKDINEDTFEGALEKYQVLNRRLYSSHQYLLKSTLLTDSDKKLFSKYIDGKLSRALLEDSLLFLSEMLYKHHDNKVYIFIDEYDTPLNSAFGKYLDPMTAFMRNLLGAALKTNSALEQGVMTGILRVSKDSMLSGLNHLKVFSLLDNAYQQYFGFSEHEVQSLFVQKSIEPKYEEVKRWYNGYKSGDLVVYNPWSIMCCLSENGKLDAYWVHAAKNNLIKECIIGADIQTKCLFETLMQGKSIKINVDKHVTFDALRKNPSAFWSLLLFAGYLRADSFSIDEASTHYNCELAIPNREIRALYSGYILEWFTEIAGLAQYNSFLDHLIQGDAQKFTIDLAAYLLKSASIFDVGNNNGEQFYHAFVLALLASLDKTHLIYSNRESGHGRYDIMLIPREKAHNLGIILEFKHVKKNEALAEAAKVALTQIDTNYYSAELFNHHHITQILKIGISFSGKSALSEFETVKILQNQHKTLLAHV